jgi:hypothetical protein
MAQQAVPDAKLLHLIDQIMSGGYDPVAAIVENEAARGFKIVRPGDTPWFRATDWQAASVASINGKRARLVLLHAFESGRGAMTRTIGAIKEAGLTPNIIAPTRELQATLRRRGWKSKHQGSTFEDRETVWFPRGES